jgi:VWFA-related protein
VKPHLQAAVAALVAFRLVAQTPALPQTAESAPPVLRVTTRLVQVSVIVTGKKNEPILGLTKDDFVVFDRGKPQQIQFFSEEARGVLPPQKDRKPLPPNVFSNKLEHRSNAPSAITVILLDMLNTKFQDQVYARNQLIKFLQQLKPSDRVALYALGRELRVLHDFTSDASSLLRTLAKHTGKPNPDLEAGELDPDLDSWLDQSTQVMDDFYQVRRTHTTFEALMAIANHVTNLPGRKNLIWISSGFPFTMGMEDDGRANLNREVRVFSEESENTARALNNANMAIYPVDARGLFTDPAFSAENRSVGNMPRQRTSRKGNSNPRPPANSGAKLRNLTKTQDIMNILANRTGGRAFYNTNDLKKAIQTAVEDSRVTYNIGYYPAGIEWDGRYREIKVQLKKPGAHLRYRLGYFAFPEKDLTPKQKETFLKDAVWSPLDSTDLGLVARIDILDPKKPNLARVIVNADAHKVQWETEGDRQKAVIDMLFLTTAQGQPAKGTTDTMTLALTKENFAKIMKEGITTMKQLELPPNSYQLRVVMRDQKSGTIGSVTIPLNNTTLKR